MTMNHDNEYHSDVNYGNRFPDNWYFMSDENYNKQEQKEGQYCYKPYRNLRNYLTWLNTNLSHKLMRIVI